AGLPATSAAARVKIGRLATQALLCQCRHLSGIRAGRPTPTSARTSWVSRPATAFDTRILGFLLNAGRSPYWFRLWVDADGLVHRAEMRGQGHFMDQDFSAFDEPLTVDVPTA